MTDATPPKLGQLPQHSDFKVPTLQSSALMDNQNGSPALQNAKDSAYNGMVSQVIASNSPFEVID